MGPKAKSGQTRHEHGSVNCISAFLGENNWSHRKVGMSGKWMVYLEVIQYASNQRANGGKVMGTNPPLPSRKGKTSTVKDIHGRPMVYTVVDEDVFVARANPNKAFAIHKFRFNDGRTEFRIGYYMIAKRPRVRGKWAWGQFAPMMTKEDMAAIFDNLRAKGWV